VAGRHKTKYLPMRSLDCLFTGLPDYPIGFSAGGGVCAKFPVVYGQSRVVCVEWLPIYIGSHSMDTTSLWVDTT